MKLVVAYIRPERLTAVKQELYRQKIYKMSVTNAIGCGQQRGYTETYRGVQIEVKLRKKVRIEIALTEPYVEQTIAAIVEGARTGAIGDGKIFVLPIQETIRIRSGERGDTAIG